MDAHALPHALVEAIERRDPEAFAAHFAPDAVGHHPFHPEPLRGREAIRDSEAAIYDSFTDVNIEVRAVMADDRRCAMEVVIRAVNNGTLDMGGQTIPAAGRSIEMPASWWYDIGDEALITGSRDYFDTATLMAQLGLTPG